MRHLIHVLVLCQLVLWTVLSYGYPSPSQNQTGDAVPTICCQPDQYSANGSTSFGPGTDFQFSLYMDYTNMQAVVFTRVQTLYYNLRDRLTFHVSDTNCITTQTRHGYPQCPIGPDSQFLSRHRVKATREREEHWVNEWKFSAVPDSDKVDKNNPTKKVLGTYILDDETCIVEHTMANFPDGSTKSIALTNFQLGIGDPTVFDVDISGCAGP